ncbi:hypothetical protein [Piscirickettsia litoralis]|uniref:Uncharacterized protein n=1 Tax=Piscirickettsia litoralis TaxID=1891921 RepID=A0ABX2ZWH0_9GAMM|nr:hypothetical protein [Piscirickettsia litoralis]ODN40962.1 hypothetical protein BGC07_18785 [Piscirickettsia litoralis]
MPRNFDQISEQERKVMFLQFANKMLNKGDIGKALQALGVTTRMEIKNRMKTGSRNDPAVFDHIKFLIGEILEMGDSISSVYTDKAQQLLNSIPSGNRRLAMDETIGPYASRNPLVFSEAAQQSLNSRGKEYQLQFG